MGIYVLFGLFNDMTVLFETDGLQVYIIQHLYLRVISFKVTSVTA